MVTILFISVKTVNITDTLTCTYTPLVGVCLPAFSDQSHTERFLEEQTEYVGKREHFKKQSWDYKKTEKRVKIILFVNHLAEMHLVHGTFTVNAYKYLCISVRVCVLARRCLLCMRLQMHCTYTYADGFDNSLCE